jgi:type VI protein secretion system component VasK
MADRIPLELILFLGATILGGLLYLLFTSYRGRRKDDDDDGGDEDAKRPESDADRAWRAKRFWWFGR